jgi:predicted Zn-dependent protease
MRAFMKLDRHAEALKDLKAGEKSDPAEASTHFLLAQTYRALGKTQEAQAEMKLFSKLEESSRGGRGTRQTTASGTKQRALTICRNARGATA